MNEPRERVHFRDRVRGRTFRAGTYTVAVCLIAVAAAVILNLLVARIPAQYTTIDLSQQELYTLSDQTLQILEGLEQDITVYILAETGSEDGYLTDLLAQYQSHSSHIKVCTRDPVLYPSFAAQYTDQELSTNSLIVESSLRSDVVPNEEIFIYSYNNYYGYSYVSDVQYAGESAITTALDYVVSENLPMVYTLTGHGEAVLGDTLSEAIGGDNMTLEDLSLLSLTALPEDADCVLLNNPTSDLSEDEAALLGAYLESGGKLLLATDYTCIGSLPNLASVLAAWGVQAVPGLVLEGDSSRCISYRNYLLPAIQDTDITSALYEGQYSVFAPNAHAIAPLASYRSSITVTPLLVTSADAYAKQDVNSAASMEQQDADAVGPFNIGVSVTEEHDGVTSQIVWYGTPLLLDDSANSVVSGANQDLILASLGSMTGSESSVSIHSKTLTPQYLTVPESAASLWSAFFIGVIPAILLLCGAVILIRRRKR